jgi:hypothetical protein
LEYLDGISSNIQSQINLKQNYSDTNSFDATRYWVSQQGYYNAVAINDLTDGKSDNSSIFLGFGSGTNDNGGNGNIAIGRRALENNTTGGSNIAVGVNTLRDNTSGWYNTAVGLQALSNNTSGQRNTAIGLDALNHNTEGIKNTAVGMWSSYMNNSGDENVVIGYFADGFNEEGSTNTIIGQEAGYAGVSHSKSGAVYLGYQAGYNDTNDNRLYIENSNSATPLIYGEFDNDLLRVNGILDINNAYQFPTSDGSNGYILQTNGSGTVSWANNPGATALQWSDTSNQLATDRDIAQKQNISDTNSVDATRYWVKQQGYYDAVAINDLSDGKTDATSVFLGSGSGTNSTGNNNTAVGKDALSANTSGFYNTAFGNSTLCMNTTGSNNTAYGTSSLYSNTTGGGNTAIGRYSLNNNASGSMNVAIGNSALFYNTIGQELTAVGYQALWQNTIGQRNTAIGSLSLRDNTSGDNNTSVGYHSLQSNTEGYSNTGVGSYSLTDNTTGSQNVAVGLYSLSSNKGGSENTALGRAAIWSNTEGSYNIGIGENALGYNTVGNNNIGIGTFSNRNNESGSNNTIIGHEAGRGSSKHSKSGNIFLGYQAGYNDTTDNKLYIENSNSVTPLIYGEFDNDLLRINGTLDINNAYQFPTSDGSSGQILQTNGSGTVSWAQNPGATALQWSDTSNQLATDRDIAQKQNISDTNSVDATRYWVTQQGYYDAVAINDLSDGKTDISSVFLGSGAGGSDVGNNNYNVAVGINAFLNNSTGTENVAIGYNALLSNTDGFKNTANGYAALYSNTTGHYNTANGYGALWSNTEGFRNTAIGLSSLWNNTTGGYNTATGVYSFHHNTIGNNNTGYGYSANMYNQEGSNNTIIGFEAGMGSSVHSKSGSVFLGYQAGYYDTTDNKLYISTEKGTDLASGKENALIYGEFDNDLLRINGTLDINNAYQFPTTDGVNLEVLQTDGSGTVSWAPIPPVPVASVNGYTGAVVLDKNDVGLGNVDNTSDLDKPISTATQAALNAKVSSQWTGTTDISFDAGNVSIGTTVVGEELEVAGDIHASGTIKSGNSITIDGVNDKITASGGEIDFEDENLITTGNVEVGGFKLTTTPSVGHILTSDADGNASWQDAPVTGAFTTTSNITSNAPGNYAVDRFVFGSSSLDNNGNDDHDKRFFFDKGNAAFRAGGVDGTQWDDINRGGHSFATGVNTTAKGDYSTAMGFDTYASGDGSTAMGQYTLASGYISTAMGQYTTASGNYSTAMGNGTTASGIYSTAMGYGTTASGDYSTAMGKGEASGIYSTAMGYGTTASGIYSTAMGYSTTASGDYSTAMGKGEASGIYSTAMGYGTTASGIYSTAMGYSTTASGDYSTAMGESTLSNSYASLALGRYNIGGGDQGNWVNDDPIFEIGIGSDNLNRANAVTVLKNGECGIGTADPGEKLEVVGNIKANGRIISYSNNTGNSITIEGDIIFTSHGDLYFGSDNLHTNGTIGTKNFVLTNSPTPGHVLTCSTYSGHSYWTAPAVASVNGQTGVVVLDKNDVGLGNVDNTSDLDKPISTATQAALNAKVSSQWTGTTDISFDAGNVSIGTTVVGEELEVAGDIHASGTIKSGNSITIDGVNDKITASGGEIDFEDEDLTTTGDVEVGTIKTQNGTSINEISTDGTLAGNSDDAVPTEKAVKAYIDALEAKVDALQTVIENMFPVQSRLDAGETPLNIYQSNNALLDSLYGKTYQGGLIFYFDTTDGTGLVAAPSDQSTGAEWGCYMTQISGAGGTSIGTGAQNTADILAGCATVGIAAYICDNLTSGAYNDWFLPSKDELNAMYTNLHQKGFGAFSDDLYWSSSEFDSPRAWYFAFDGSGYVQSLNKNNPHYVRAVRAF